MARAATSSLPEKASYRSLRGRDAFSRVYRKGSRRRIGSVVVFRAESEDDVPEVGFVAGRQVGNAVARNRAKRRLREAGRLAGFPAGTAWIVVARPGVNEAPFAELVGWLAEAARSGSVRQSGRLLDKEEQ